jgi:hypothetical protein
MHGGEGGKDEAADLDTSTPLESKKSLWILPQKSNFATEPDGSASGLAGESSAEALLGIWWTSELAVRFYSTQGGL